MPTGVYKRNEYHVNKLRNANNKGWFKINHKTNKGKISKLRGKKQNFKNPEERGRKISLSKRGVPHFNQRGKNNPRWKGGITPEIRKIRTSLEYKIWRRAVFERDNYTCVWCKKRSGNGKAIILHADHIKSFCDYPELRFAIDNGRTLCIDCHKTTDTYGAKLWIKREFEK